MVASRGAPRRPSFIGHRADRDRQSGFFRRLRRPSRPRQSRVPALSEHRRPKTGDREPSDRSHDPSPDTPFKVCAHSIVPRTINRLSTAFWATILRSARSLRSVSSCRGARGPPLVAHPVDAFAHRLRRIIPPEPHGQGRQRTEDREREAIGHRRHVRGANQDHNCGQHPYSREHDLYLL
jgi:hypothetical protein